MSMPDFLGKVLFGTENLNRVERDRLLPQISNHVWVGAGAVALEERFDPRSLSSVALLCNSWANLEPRVTDRCVVCLQAHVVQFLHNFARHQCFSAYSQALNAQERQTLSKIGINVTQRDAETWSHVSAQVNSARSCSAPNETSQRLLVCRTVIVRLWIPGLSAGHILKTWLFVEICGTILRAFWSEED